MPGVRRTKMTTPPRRFSRSTSKQPDSDTSAVANLGRWWEGYLVRYLVGSLVGSIVLVVLFVEFRHGKNHYLETYVSLARTLFGKDSVAVGLALFVAGGLYCYLASAPITVIHAGRMFRSKSSSAMWVAVSLLCLLLGGAALFCAPCFHGNTAEWFTLFFVSLPALYVAFTQWSVWRKMILDRPTVINTDLPDGTERTYVETFFQWCAKSNQKSQVSDPSIKQMESKYLGFNRELAKARGSGTRSTKEIRETYSHLREHANAIFIVALEISICAVLIAAHRFLDTANLGAAHPNFWIFALCGLVVWLVPNVLLWGQANQLETDLRTHREHYNS